MQKFENVVYLVFIRIWRSTDVAGDYSAWPSLVLPHLLSRYIAMILVLEAICMVVVSLLQLGSVLV
jgi:hypothetical protein